MSNGQHTINSKTHVVYSDILDIANQGVEEMFNLPENQVLVTYRHYNQNNDNISGDLLRTDYTEYQLYAIVLVALIDDRIVQAGELLPGDVELFIRPYISFEYDGTEIEEPFEPKVDDEILYNNQRYRLKLIRYERIENTKLVVDCLCSRLNNAMPDKEWNKNYRTPVNDEGSYGGGWS